MDLIYKIYSVYLYDNALEHEWVFFYNRTKSFTGEVKWDAPYLMFGSYDWSASTQIFRMDKTAKDFKDQSFLLMKAAADKEGIVFMKGSDFISLVALEEGKVSYSGALPDDKVELEGKYKGLKKNVYTPYDIMWNESKSGFNPHEFEVMGVWKEGSSSYSAYRIWEEAAEREKTIRDNKLNMLGV